MKKISAVLVVLALATVASADLVDIVKTNTFTLEGADYDVYEVIVEPTTPGFRLYSVSVPLLQAAEVETNFLGETTVENTPYAAMIPSAAQERGMDSHFMVEDTNNIIPQEVAETSDLAIGVSGPNNYYTFGFGDLVGAYSWKVQVDGINVSPTENWSAAQLVVAAGSEFTVTGETGTTGEEVPFQMTVPEPATMTLLAIGGLGALIRRKRR